MDVSRERADQLELESRQLHQDSVLPELIFPGKLEMADLLVKSPLFLMYPLLQKNICVILCRLNIILMKKIHPWVILQPRDQSQHRLGLGKGLGERVESQRPCLSNRYIVMMRETACTETRVLRCRAVLS